ncbi:hypothetical protein BGZ47_001853 [Haplosporangium gracile]|nr:hypothetical protein BGZ47_001853 [Haplosporangium gracile]
MHPILRPLMIQRLEADSIEQDGRIIYKELLDNYPAIGEPKFFDSELLKDHDVFNWNDYHYIDGMDYKPPPVLQNSEEYEPPKDKTKKPDNKVSKDKSGYKSDSDKSGNKLDGGKSGGNLWNKSGGGQGRKQSEQGNDGEKSD